jgi:hypothetical protein
MLLIWFLNHYVNLAIQFKVTVIFSSNRFFLAYNGVATGLSFITREYTDKLKSLMTIEDFFKLKKNLTRAGWDSTTGGFLPETNKELVLRAVTDMMAEYAIKQNNENLHPNMSNASTLSSATEDSYPISDYSSSDSDSDNDSEEEERKRKRIPEWAKGSSLESTLRHQQFADPDKIFPEMNSCDLDGNLHIL